MRKYYVLFLGFIGGVLPLPVFATVCGVMPESYELALNIIGLTRVILFLAMTVIGSRYMYAYFAEKESDWAGRYFWWLLGGFIITVIVGILVYLDAPKACGLEPYVDIPII